MINPLTKVLTMRALLILALIPLLIACGETQTEKSSEYAQSPSKDPTEKSAMAEPLVVYKSPTCGCCGAWVDHIKNAGVSTSIIEDADMNEVKNSFQLPVEARSCHTAIYKDYFFEGHVPPALVQSFINSPPKNAKGLVVPGMPIGSAGMEDGDKFQPYKVWVMLDNGEFEEYAAIDTYNQQF
jgi:hypothetical protein